MTLDTVAADGQVTGTQTILRPLSGEQSAPIAQDLPDGVMPRAATFVLAPFMGLEPGQSVTYDWYASLANSGATVTVTAFEGGAVDTPTGRYEDTLRLEVRGTQPENDIFVSEGEVVRIDVIGRDMTFLRRPDPEPTAE